jgi:hypothetical protein
MSRLRSLLVYQDESSSLSLRLLFMIIPAVFWAVSIYLWSARDPSAGVALLAAGLLMSGIFLVVFPRKYQVYEDCLRIVLGGPFAITLPFDRIKNVEITSRTGFTMNLVNRITREYTLIVTKGGLNFAITPASNETFVERSRQAIEEWARTRGEHAYSMKH